MKSPRNSASPAESKSRQTEARLEEDERNRGPPRDNVEELPKHSPLLEQEGWPRRQKSLESADGVVNPVLTTRLRLSKEASAMFFLMRATPPSRRGLAAFLRFHPLGNARLAGTLQVLQQLSARCENQDRLGVHGTLVSFHAFCKRVERRVSIVRLRVDRVACASALPRVS